MRKEPKKSVTATRNKYTAQHRADARRYYLMGLNLTEIGILLGGCPIRTLEKWQSAEKWTEYKQLKSIKAKAYELHQAGKTQKEIAEMLHVCKATISRYIKEVKENQKE